VHYKLILNTLSDGAWHKFDELSAETQLEKDTVLKIVNLLKDFGFVEIDLKSEEAKLDNYYKNL
jgi:DNA-binding IclR family transcriptional regulator